MITQAEVSQAVKTIIRQIHIFIKERTTLEAKQSPVSDCSCVSSDEPLFIKL